MAESESVLDFPKPQSLRQNPRAIPAAFSWKYLAKPIHGSGW
jgi:hypothetical protein